MKPHKPCAKCGKHPRLKGSYYCAECKAETVRLAREKKRIYMRARAAAKRAAEAAEQAASAAEAVAEKMITIAPTGQWTTTSITTFTTNGENPPTVHTETKTEPVVEKPNRHTAASKGLCAHCGERPRLPGRSYCMECWHELDRARYRKLYARHKAEKASGVRTGAFAKPCTKCGGGPRVVGKSICKDCYNKIQSERGRAKRAKLKKEPILTVKLCSKCGKYPRIKGRGLCRACHNEYQREWYHNHLEKARESGRKSYAKRKAAWELERALLAKNMPMVIQQNVQNNAPTVIPEKTLTQPIPEIPKVAEKAPMVVQQNIQNNAPASAEKPVALPDTINVNVTSPIKVEHNHSSIPYAIIGYVMAVIFFLIWLGTLFKHWVR